MRAALAMTLLSIAAAVASPIGLARAATANPTPGEIGTAVRRAEASPSLWATINICNSPRYPNTLGIRGQMPALGFASWMSMEVEVDYYSKAKHGFEPAAHVSALIRLGRVSSNLQQAGTTWAFKPHSGLLLNATINFVWRRSGKLLGQTRRRTTAGHRDADFGSPPHYSAEQCLIK